MDIHPADVKPGDWAEHKSGNLDPRPVHDADPRAGWVRLQIGSAITDRLKIDGYYYSRD